MAFMTSTYHIFAVRYLNARRLSSFFSISNVFCPLNKILKNCYMRYHNRTFRMQVRKKFSENILVLVRISET